MVDPEVVIALSASTEEDQLFAALLAAEGVKLSPKRRQRLGSTGPSTVYVLAMAVGANLTADSLKLAVRRAIKALCERAPSARARIHEDLDFDAEQLRPEPESWGSE